MFFIKVWVWIFLLFNLVVIGNWSKKVLREMVLRLVLVCMVFFVSWVLVVIWRLFIRVVNWV